MSRSKNKNELNKENCSKTEQKSFFQRIMDDKKYSAKIQLIGYGVLVIVLIVYLNIANMGRSSFSGNIISDDVSGDNTILENTDTESSNLLKEIHDNYQYDQHVTLKKNSSGFEEEFSLHYFGKSYDKNLEINKESATDTQTYYKIDDRYYIKEDTGVVLTDVDVIYDLVGGEYLEFDDIQKLMEKASLDHVTDYSSGKKEYVYHLKVKDVILSYRGDDVVEMNVTIENHILMFEIDYSNLLKLVDDSILECKLESIYTEIGKVEEFEVLNQEEENASLE